MFEQSDVACVLAALERSAEDNRSVTFVLEAVKDIQETIRAIDTKVGILLAALAIPIPFVDKAFSAIDQHGAALGPRTILGAIGFVTYILAALVAVRALTGIGNAAEHVVGDERPDDIFYAGGLFALGWIDAVLTRGNLRSRRSVESYVAGIPRSAAAVLHHLAHEVLSLAYIRDLKIHRQRIAFELTAAAVVLGALALVL
ncbi:MAG: hypothetical protein GIX03_13300 [Candidatus Eremiobacteraeota bacterium]|nr:hypothetical protein [Candidatus Eremiobacteraeota bacterium]MBC5803942.1 hypothetical protein [Candidatus Eremiobacteraeota bacterium]MBC5822350.1 hypothetical protein [Candidatus Eremiobacteraeota bacterium]